MDPHNYTSQLKEVDLTETLSSAESSVSKSSISTAGSRDVKDCSKTGSGSGRPKSAVKVEHERFTDTKVLRPRRYGVQNGVRFHVKGTVQEITSLPLLFAHGRYRKLDPRDNSLQVKTDLPCFDYVHFQHITCDHALVRISDRQDLENVYVSKKMWSETEFVHINDIPHRREKPYSKSKAYVVFLTSVFHKVLVISVLAHKLFYSEEHTFVKSLVQIFCRLLMRCIGIELVCDPDLKVPFFIEVLVPRHVLVPDLQYVSCKKGLFKLRPNKRWRSRVKVLLDFHGGRIGSLLKVAAIILRDQGASSTEADWCVTDFQEIWLTRLHKWCWRSATQKTIIRNQHSDWKEFVKDLAKDGVKLWEENDFLIMSTCQEQCTRIESIMSPVPLRRLRLSLQFTSPSTELRTHIPLFWQKQMPSRTNTALRYSLLRTTQDRDTSTARNAARIKPLHSTLP